MKLKRFKKKKLDVNKDAYYLNRFIRISQPEQPFDSLNNDRKLHCQYRFQEDDSRKSHCNSCEESLRSQTNRYSRA